MFWKGKRVLVTGGCGFVGSHLVEMLLDGGASVAVLDDLSRGKYQIKKAHYVYGDAGREGTCRDTVKGSHVVFNLAAEVAGVEFNQKNHFFMFTKNYRLLNMPLAVAAAYGVERFVQMSSVCVYAPGYNNPCKEEAGLVGTPTHANRGYSMAKRIGEMMADWCHKDTGLHTIVCRPSNIYGPRDYFDGRAHVIPALIKKCLTPSDAIVVNGHGHEVREFIYVEDVARGLMAAAEMGHPGDVYNIGTRGTTKISIKDLLFKIQALTGTTDKRVKWGNLFDGGDNERWSIGNKAREELGWVSSVGLEEGLTKTVAWYRGK